LRHITVVHSKEHTLINRLTLISALLVFAFATTIASYAQHEEEHAPQAQHGPVAPHEPAPQHAPKGPPAASYGGAYHGWTQANGPTHGGVHHSGVPQNHDQVVAGFNQSHAHTFETEHQTWTARGGYHGYRVPDDRFRMYFGRPHPFRIYGLPLLFVGGYPRFQYDGYWMTLVDPWPESWPANWYDSDEVYVDYTNDGYYLYDVTRGGPGIAVTLSF
jgi:hypothetical protein